MISYRYQQVLGHVVCLCSVPCEFILPQKRLKFFLPRLTRGNRTVEVATDAVHKWIPAQVTVATDNSEIFVCEIPYDQPISSVLVRVSLDREAVIRCHCVWQLGPMSPTIVRGENLLETTFEAVWERTTETPESAFPIGLWTSCDAGMMCSSAFRQGEDPCASVLPIETAVVWSVPPTRWEVVLAQSMKLKIWWFDAPLPTAVTAMLALCRRVAEIVQIVVNSESRDNKIHLCVFDDVCYPAIEDGIMTDECQKIIFVEAPTFLSLVGMNKNDIDSLFSTSFAWSLMLNLVKMWLNVKAIDAERFLAAGLAMLHGKKGLELVTAQHARLRRNATLDLLSATRCSTVDVHATVFRLQLLRNCAEPVVGAFITPLRPLPQGEYLAWKFEVLIICQPTLFKAENLSGRLLLKCAVSVVTTAGTPTLPLCIQINVFGEKNNVESLAESVRFRLTPQEILSAAPKAFYREVSLFLAMTAIKWTTTEEPESTNFDHSPPRPRMFLQARVDPFRHLLFAIGSIRYRVLDFDPDVSGIPANIQVPNRISIVSKRDRDQHGAALQHGPVPRKETANVTDSLPERQSNDPQMQIVDQRTAAFLI